MFELTSGWTAWPTWPNTSALGSRDDGEVISRLGLIPPPTVAFVLRVDAFAVHFHSFMFGIC